MWNMKFGYGKPVLSVLCLLLLVMLLYYGVAIFHRDMYTVNVKSSTASGAAKRPAYMQPYKKKLLWKHPRKPGQKRVLIATPPKTTTKQPPTTTTKKTVSPPYIHQGMSMRDVETLFFKQITEPKYNCRNVRRMGNAGDGGWDICLDPEFFPHTPCIVYSFGIANDWSFDDAISNAFSCEDHAFDPSIGKPDHKHSKLVSFHNLGVAEHDSPSNANGWKLQSVNTIRQALGHSNKNIDVLKMDTEGAEWQAIPSMVKKGDLDHIKQFCFELHFNQNGGKGYFIEMHKLIKSLEDNGFRLFKQHANPVCTYRSPHTGRTYSFCQELYYVNTKFVKT